MTIETVKRCGGLQLRGGFGRAVGTGGCAMAHFCFVPGTPAAQRGGPRAVA
jgi:hypothetical protein